MSWIKSPTSLRCASVPYDVAESMFAYDFYVGRDADAGLFAFYSFSTGAYVISDSLTMSLTVFGVTLTTNLHSFVNGYVYYSNSNWNYYYTDAYGWVLARNTIPLGSDPREEQDEDGNYVGDEFYAGAPPELDQTASLAPRGSIRDSGSAVSMATKFPRWQSATQCGVYSAKGGKSGTKVFGLPQFTLSSGVTAVRSLEKGSNGSYTYGPVYCLDGEWLIGVKGSDTGWWEGSEPDVESEVFFMFTTNPDSALSGEGITVAFDKYVLGDNTEKHYIGEVAIWR